MTNPASPQNFAQLRILTDDFPASYRFYTDVLGLASKDPSANEEQGPYVCFAIGNTDVALFMRAFMDASITAEHLPRGDADHTVIALRVPDVDAAFAEADARGAVTVAKPRDMPAWGMRVAHVRAPEGTLIEFCQDED